MSNTAKVEAKKCHLLHLYITLFHMVHSVYNTSAQAQATILTLEQTVTILAGCPALTHS